jgi:hypothetical protein
VKFYDDTLWWNMSFTRPVHDWKVESVTSLFFCTLSGLDEVAWIKSIGSLLKGGHSRLDLFIMCFALVGSHFPWKSIWRNKVLSRVAFCVWTAMFGKILTLDNQRKRYVIVMDWCCMYKKSRETIDHFLFHCEVVRALWVLTYRLFGLEWVMPQRVVELLASWRGQFSNSCNLEAWSNVVYLERA